MGHNSKVPIRIYDRYLQIILRFAKYRPPCEGRGKWIMDYEYFLLGPFFLSVFLKTQPNHWTRRMVSTRLTT